MTDSLWVEATRDIEAENESRRVAYVATAAADVWPFLAAAQSRPEYVSRKALAAERIDAAVEVVAERGTGAFERLRENLIAQLDADFDALYDSPQRVAARQQEEMRRASQAIGAEIMRRESAGLDNLGDNRAKPFGSKDDDDDDDDKKKSSKTAVHLNKVRKTDDPLIFEGTGPDGNTVKFRVSESESKQLRDVMLGDLAQNFSGVTVDDTDIVKGAMRLVAYSAPDGTRAKCGKCGKDIQSMDYAWYHMAKDYPNGEDHPAHPSVHNTSPASAPRGRQSRGSHIAALIDSITDNDIKAFAITLGDMDDKPYQATCPNKDCDNHGTAFVHDDLASDNSGDDETAHCPDCNTPLVFEQRKQGAGRRNDFSLSDAKNEAGEWTMSPEQIRAEQAASDEPDDDPYGDDDDYRGRRGSRHPFVRNAARDIHDLRRDVGEAMKRYLHPDYHADGQAVLDRTHDAVLDHLADMYGWTVENAQSHKEHHDKVADSVAAHVYETAPFTEHAPPRHHAKTATDDGSRMMRCPNCKTVWRGDDGDKCTCGTTMVRRDASLHTAEEHGGYHLEEAEGGWFVVNHIGERKNNEPMDHDAALKYQRALMVNVPGAKEDAERHEKNSMRLHPAKADGAHISAFAIACGDWDDWGERYQRIAAAPHMTEQEVRNYVPHRWVDEDGEGRCLRCGMTESEAIPEDGPMKSCRAAHSAAVGRVACKKCVAGHDPSGGICDYCDGQGSLDLTLAMVKAADGWDQGITREAFKTAEDRTICPYCDYSGTNAEVGKHIADEGPQHQQRGTVTDQVNDRIRHGHLTRSGEGPARPAGDSRHFHTIEPEGDKWHIYRMPRSQVGQGRGRNKVKVSTHDTHEQAVAELNRLKGNVTAVNTDATGADRYNRTPAPRVPDWISQWSDDDARADTSQHNEGRAGSDSANPVTNHAIEEPNSRYVYKPVAKVGWLDFTSAQQMLGQLDGRDVALTYDDDFGITTCAGRLAYAGKSVTITSANGKAVTVPVQHVLNVAASGYSTTDVAAGQGAREPGLMDHLVHAWPSGAMASRTVTANPYSPNLNPYTTDGPGHPDRGGTPGDSGGAAGPSDPGQGAGANPTTTRPRVKPSTDYTDGDGGSSGLSGQQPPSLTPAWEPSGQGGSSSAPWRAAASLREAEEWYASPVRQKVAAKAKAIADTIQGSNPGMGRGQALGFAVETIRAFPRVVGGIAPTALGGVLDRYLMELSQA